MDWVDTLWVISYLFVVLGLSGYGIHRYVMVYLFTKHAKDTPKPARNWETLPTVTVQLPIFNELHVVERLVQSVAELDYPKDRLHIQVLDDSTDETRAICEEEVQKLVAAGYDAELIHRVDRTGFKAGALENGMPAAKGEFIFILDADFVPPKGVLHDMIHYFTDDKVGLIQTRWGHINREYSLLTRIQAMFLDGHLIVEQTARSRSGRFINFNGTAGMWRKSCIVEAGGWQHDTLTEDLDLSYRAQMKGWKFVFLKDVVTPAELPVDMNGFKNQQHRWAKGSVQTCKKLLKTVWKSDQPLIIKLEATAHLTSNFAYLLLIFLCFLIYPGASPDGLEFGGYRFLVLDLPVFLIVVSVGAFYICSQRAIYPKNWIKEILLLPCLLALGIGMSINNGKAVLEALFNYETPFVRTPKYGIGKSRTQTWRLSGYSAMKSIGLVFELILALYFTYLVMYAFANEIWSSLPFMILFMLGFWYVATGSVAQMLPGSWFQQDKDRGDSAAIA
jgi:cellulose synthase/poly-beta-1,6-N-acetylglucosamine synthase-like glycosyltransferase